MGDHFAAAGRQRPGLGRARQARGRRPRHVRRLLRQRRPRAGQRGLARPRLPGHLAGQRRQPGRPGPGRAPRLPPRLHGPRPGRGATPPTCTRSPRCSPSRARSPTSTCRWRPDRRCYLPHSQKYGAGYLAFHDPAFTAYFEEHHVQLPLDKGDAVFFNPALFHGAGTNHTSRRRPHGEPAAGLHRLRPRDGDGRHPGDLHRGLPRGAAAQGRRGRRPGADQPGRPPRPRATPSPPTSTWTSRSERWPRRPRPTCSAARWTRAGRPRPWPRRSPPSRAAAAPRSADPRCPGGRHDPARGWAARGPGRPGQRRHPGPRRRASPAAAAREGAAVVVTGRRRDVGEKRASPS